MRDSEEKYRTLLQAIPDIVYKLSADGNFIFINDAIRSLGYEPAELIGKHFSVIVHPEDVKAVARLEVLPKLKGQAIGDEKAPKLFDERRTGKRMTRNLEIRLVPRNGADLQFGEVFSYGEIIAAGQFLPDVSAKDKQYLGTVGIIRDITVRRRQEKLLQQQKTAMATSMDGIAIVDADGHFTYVNAAFVNMYGFDSPDVLLGKSWEILYGEEELKRFKGKIMPKLAKHGYWRGEAVALKRNGEAFPEEITMNALEGGGLVCVARDISHRKLAEQIKQQMLQSDKMRALGEVLSGAAHELNNPLTAILGYAQLMQTASSLEEIKSDLDAVSHEAKRCAAIVQNLVAFARKRGPKREPCDINKLISDTLKLRAYQMTVDNVQLAVHLDEQIPTTMADPQQLQQVFLNIISNAVQSMEKSPARRLEISSQLVGDTCRMTFQDSGTGIPADMLTRIFEPFFTTKEAGKGTGLGLSLCYGIVTEHGGKIWAESGAGASGQGAAFTIELPMVPPPVLYEVDADVRSDGGSAGKKARILVVDDESAVRAVMDRYFGKLGFRVTAVASIPEAIRELDRAKFDLILSDHKMPGGSGEDLYEHVKTHQPNLLKNFILITGDVLNPASSQFIEKTKVRVLEKPFELETLRHTISDLLTNSLPLL